MLSRAKHLLASLIGICEIVKREKKSYHCLSCSLIYLLISLLIHVVLKTLTGKLVRELHCSTRSLATRETVGRSDGLTFPNSQLVKLAGKRLETVSKGGFEPACWLLAELCDLTAENLTKA